VTFPFSIHSFRKKAIPSERPPIEPQAMVSTRAQAPHTSRFRSAEEEESMSDAMIIMVILVLTAVSAGYILWTDRNNGQGKQQRH